MRELIKTWTGRAIIASFALFAFAIIYFASVQLATQRDTFAPLEYQNPLIVASPVSLANPVTTITLTRCNHSSEPISVESSFSVRNLQTRQLVPQIRILAAPPGVTQTGTSTSISVWDSGCEDIKAELKINGLTEGMWRMEGRGIARSDHNETQIAAFFSTPFEVVP